MKEPKNLLIVRTDRIGDVVLSLPLAHIIKKYYPGCRITFLLREYTKSLAEGNPNIDEVLLLKTAGTKVHLLENISELRSRKFDSVIIVYPTFEISAIIFLSGIPVRIGTGYRWYSFLFNKKVYEHRKYAQKHELEYNIGMLEQLGIKNVRPEDKRDFNININQTSLQKVKSILKEKGLDITKPVIAVHPGSGGSAADLPLDKFREYINLVKENTDSNIVITGSSSEIDKCKYLAEVNGAYSLAGLFNLSELTALVSLCSIFVSNSTGPLHIAAALGKYVIGFYPKVMACSPKRWGPYTSRGYTFTPQIECKNCTVEQCIKLNCMSTIDINTVFEKTRKILKLLLNTGESDEK